MQYINKVYKGVGAVVAAVVFAAVLAVALPGSAAADNPLEPYCKHKPKPNCLELIDVTITHTCEGTVPSFHYEFTNPNDEDAPRDIFLYLNGEEFFQDSGFAASGTSPLTFSPPAESFPGAWSTVVSWNGHVFAQEASTCHESDL